jgi:hypothetical protein
MFCRAIGDERGVFVGFSLLALFFHFVAFICTIVMSRVDVLISIRGGYGSLETVTTTSSTEVTTSASSSSAWATLLLADTGFESDLETWKSLNRLRVVAAVLAWACCCFVVWRDLTTVEKKGADLRKYVLRASHACYYILLMCVHTVTVADILCVCTGSVEIYQAIEKSMF